MKKAFLFIISFLLVTSLLFASGNKEAGEKTTVTIWHSAQGKGTSAFEEIVEDFNASLGKEKGIEINAIYQGKANDVLTKVNAAMGTSTLPDIAMMDATAATDMSRSKYLVTVDELGADTSSILQSGIDSYSSEKGLIAMPFNGSALIFYYNKTLFDSLGIEAPKTISQLKEIAPRLAEKDKNGSLTRSAFAGVPTTYELSYFICAQKGGSYMVNNNNGHLGLPTEVLFGKEGTYKAFLTEWKALFDTGFCSPLSSGVTDAFASGQTASMLASSSQLTSVISKVDGAFEVGTARVPVVNEEADGGAIISGGALYSFTNSEKVRIVLEYLTSPSVQALWAEATGYVPVNTKTWETEEYKSFLENNPSHKTAGEALMDSKKGMVNVWIPSAYTIYYAFQKNVMDVISGRDIDSAINEMVSIVEDALSSYSSQNQPSAS